MKIKSQDLAADVTVQFVLGELLPQKIMTPPPTTTPHGRTTASGIPAETPLPTAAVNSLGPNMTPFATNNYLSPFLTAEVNSLGPNMTPFAPNNYHRGTTVSFDVLLSADDPLEHSSPMKISHSPFMDTPSKAETEWNALDKRPLSAMSSPSGDSSKRLCDVDDEEERRSYVLKVIKRLKKKRRDVLEQAGIPDEQMRYMNYWLAGKNLDRIYVENAGAKLLAWAQKSGVHGRVESSLTEQHGPSETLIFVNPLISLIPTNRLLNTPVFGSSMSMFGSPSAMEKQCLTSPSPHGLAFALGSMALPTNTPTPIYDGKRGREVGLEKPYTHRRQLFRENTRENM